MTRGFEHGSVEAFEANWTQRPEGRRYHFTRGAPENQLQFAFQNHWRVFRSILGGVRSGRVLEVGCGRGSMGAFFSEAGFEVHLVDTSHSVLNVARANFAADGLRGHYVCGDALALPYPAGTFDVVVSVGLMEHFRQIGPPLQEQVRVLRPRGTLLAYVVPRQLLSVQALAAPINLALRVGDVLARRRNANGHAAGELPKAALYRNACTAAQYLAALRRFGVAESGSCGMFPVPLVSHSPSFPFSPMAPPLEQRLVKLWQRVLPVQDGRPDPWLCPEWWGLAFLVWARKGGPRCAR